MNIKHNLDLELLAFRFHKYCYFEIIYSLELLAFRFHKYCYLRLFIQSKTSYIYFIRYTHGINY